MIPANPPPPTAVNRDWIDHSKIILSKIVDYRIGRLGLSLFAILSSIYLTSRINQTIFSQAVRLNPSIDRKYQLGKLLAMNVVSPFIEELLLRTILQNGLKYVQFSLSLEAAPKREGLYLVERVRAIALLSGFLAVRGSTYSAGLKVMQFASATLSSLGNGYLYDKYHTLSIPYLSHAIHNMIITSCLPSVCLIQELTAFYFLMIKSTFVHRVVKSNNYNWPKLK